MDHPRRIPAWAAAATLCAALLAHGSPAEAQANQSESLRDAHRALQLSTAGSLLVTATLGTMLAMNRATLFSDGRCAPGGAEPIFGQYGCKGLSVVHGLSAIISTVLYTATVATEFAAFDWPGQNHHGTAYDIASGFHLGAMAVLPIVGIITAVPFVLGIDPQHVSTFQRVMRTIHLSIAYLAVGSYMATTAIDL